MNCAKCGLDLPDGARHCPKCGYVNEFVQPQKEKKKASPLIYVAAGLGALIILCVIATILFSKSGRNVTSAPSGSLPPSNVTAAPGPEPGPGNVVSAPQGQLPNDTSQPNVKKPKPPAEVVAYLDFVKKVEEHRQMLLKDTDDALSLAATTGQAKSLMNLIDMASDPNGTEAQDPLKDTKKELTRQYKNWISTLKYFDEKTAPDTCRDFSGAYRLVIYTETKTIGEVAVGLSKVDITNPDDMSKLLATLKKMKADPSVQENIDKSADTADASLTKLVSQYDMEKPFDVPREKKNGNIMAF